MLGLAFARGSRPSEISISPIWASSGFGNMMTGIGLPIGFGVILGQLLNDSGAAGVIADKIVSGPFPRSRCPGRES